MKFKSETVWRSGIGGLLVFLVLYPAFLYADEIRPALLQIDEREGGWIDVTWKIPVRQDRGLGLTPVLPDFFEPTGPVSGQRTAGGGYVEYSSYRSGGKALTGATLKIDGLGPIQTDVLVRIALADGSAHSTILRAGNDSFTIPEQATRLQLAISYWQMGTIHILEGFDHLLFLLVLLLIVTGLWPLLKTVTAFTVAHSLTLALATLGIVNIPPAPTEAVISLSIMLLAVEAVRKSVGEVTLAERYPWLIAFHVRPRARTRVCRRAVRDRRAAERSAARIADVQRRRRDRAGHIRGCGLVTARGVAQTARPDGRDPVPRGALCDRRQRRVLDDPARQLVS